MELNDQKVRNKLTYSLIFALGIMLIIISYLFPHVSGITTSIGTSILASVIIYVLLNSFVGDPLKPIVDKLQKVDMNLRESVNLLEQASDVGICGVWNSRANLDTNYWIEKMKNAKGNIDILGYAVAFLPEHPDFNSIIELKENCKVRILLGRPDSDSVLARTKEEKNEGLISERIKTTLIRLKPLIDKGLVEVKLHDTPLYCSIYRFDDEMLVTPQLYGLRGSKAPLLQIKKVDKGLYCTYVENFNLLWSEADEFEEKYVKVA